MDASDWDARYTDVDLVWGAAPNRFVERECRGLAPGRAIDLACGEGRHTIWLAREGWDARGLDYSPVAVERARRLASEADIEHGRARFDVGDVTEVDLDTSGPVDLVVVAYVHLPPVEREHVFTAAARALRPDGHLVIVGHDRRNLAEGVSGPQDIDLLYDATSCQAVVRATRPYLRTVTAGVEPRPTDAGTAWDTVVHLTV